MMANLVFPPGSADDLDLEIGRTLLADDLGSKEVGEDEARALGARWFSGRLEAFKAAVCASMAVREHLSGVRAKTRNELFAAICDALLTAAGLGGVPVATLSARLVHYGVERLCGDCVKS